MLRIAGQLRKINEFSPVISAYHTKYFAYELTRRCPTDSIEKLAGALVDAQVDLNLTVKKIPKQVLSRCEWGHDDYSLQVENLPKEPPKAGQQSLFDGKA